MFRFVALLALVLLAFPVAAIATVEGRVRTATGSPVDHARVEVPAAGISVSTDPEGRFVLPEVEPPIEIRITHPRFHPSTMEVVDSAAIEIVLEVKQEVYEEIVISANRGGGKSFSPVSVATSSIDPGAAAVLPSTVAALVTESPGVSENGQGGLFQVFSVRGVSRQRVLTLIDGMRIAGDRRAGVSASFVDPYLLQTAEVLRGPSSTWYGSDALGGVVQLLPRRYVSWGAQLGYSGQGDENWQALSWGDGSWSLGLARRAADNAETPDGEELNSGFEQISGAARRSWGEGRRSYEVLVIGSAGRDIGKANTDYPQRTTIYPEEDHLLVKFAINASDRWRLEAYAHPNDLETDVLRVGERRNVVFNDATDLGLSWTGRSGFGKSGSARYGVDYFGRRSVDSREIELDPESGAIRNEQQTLSGGVEDQVGAFGAIEWNWGRAAFLAGARGTWHQQDSDVDERRDDTALSGFVGIVMPLGAGFELAANAGSGLRFPTLAERYFSGTTGRGEVVGNPELERERSLSFDLGMRWYGERLFVAAYVFQNRISDYIERIEIGEDLLTFVNLTSGRISGFEIDGHYRLDGNWNLTFGGHLLDGEDDDNNPLADIPADRLFVGVRYVGERWDGRLRWEERADKDDPGSGEKEIPAASLVTASIGYRWASGLTLRLEGRNLLDEEYFSSADEQVPLSPARSLGLSAIWTAP